MFLCSSSYTLPQRADACALCRASPCPHFPAHFARTTCPAGHGIPKFQISTDSPYPSEITRDPHKICVQNRSNFFNMLKFLTITEHQRRRTVKTRKMGRGGDCGQIGSANGANRQGHLNIEKGARTTVLTP